MRPGRQPGKYGRYISIPGRRVISTRVNSAPCNWYDEAAALGAERFVLDDGWMQDRTCDQRGLGDWKPCTTRYPRGLEPIARAVREANMQFGLWIEPEMVNLDSEIARRHPEWILRDGDRIQPVGRHQYALDLCREDVYHHLLDTITGLVSPPGTGLPEVGYESGPGPLRDR